MALVLDDDFIEFMNYNYDDLYNNRIHRHIPEYLNPFEKFSELQFVKRYRFSMDIVRHRILPLIYDVNANGRRGLPVPPYIKLTTALRFFATGSYQVSTYSNFMFYSFLKKLT